MKTFTKSFRKHSLTGVVVVSAVCSAQAHDQSSETQASSGDAQALNTISVAAASTSELALARGREAPPQLEEVIVTATKRSEPVREIPATVNVLLGEQLERQGVQSIDQIVSLVPGVNLTDEGTGGTAKRITIRGISTTSGVNATAGTLLGDIPFSDPFIPKVQLDPNPFDMATVEVLKGPQGTLFGGTGLNGLIRYVPEAPDLNEFRVKYFSQYSAYPGNGGSAWSYGGAVNAPFADHTAAVRLMAFHRDAPGYVDTQNTGERDVNKLSQYGVRGMLTWVPDELWKITLLATTQKTHNDDTPFTDNYDGRLERSNAPRPSPDTARYTLANLGIDRAFEWGNLISQTSYVKKSYDTFVEASRAFGGQLPLLAAADDNHSRGITQELRAVSAPSDSPWKWLVGGFYYDMKLYDCATVGAAENFPSLPPIEFLDGLLAIPCSGNVGKVGDTLPIGQLIGDIDLQENALFGEVTRELGDSWEATLGARAYRIKTDGAIGSSGLLYAVANQGMSGERSAGVSQNGISPKASIVYKINDDVRSYFTASRGFRFGGPQIAASTPTTTVPTVYKSDSLWNYELGVRSDWFDKTLRIDASAYHLDWKNPQIYQISADGLTGYIDNVGGARGDGVEASLRYLLPFLRGLSLNAAGSYNRTVTSKAFVSPTSDDPGPVPSGSPWPLAPHWQTSSSIDYVYPMDSWEFGAQARHTYLSKACNSIDCTAMVFGYQTWDLNLFAGGGADSAWPQLSVSLNNLTDKRGIGNVTSNPFPAGDTVTYIAPRAVIVRVSGSF